MIANQQWRAVQLFLCRLRLTGIVHLIPLILVCLTKWWPMSCATGVIFGLIFLYWFFHRSKVKGVLLAYSITHVINLILHVVLILYLLASQIKRLSAFYYVTFVWLIADTVLICITLYNSFWLYQSLSAAIIRF